MSDPRAASGDGFRVDPWTHWLGGLVERNPGLWRRLGDLETRLLADQLEEVAIHQPIYVTGLARAGSTLLLELLDQHPATGAHRYRDFPLLYTPYWWNRFLDCVPLRAQAPAERAQRDGMLVTADSPEAFEEVLWMAFFPGSHRPARSAVLAADTEHRAFERFYRDHIRKLLLVRHAERYLAKANYNLTRLPYLLRLFPDARFVIPVREPAWHIASLMKQQQLFSRGQQHAARARVHLRRAGHFEFGLDRRPINTGDAAEIARIQALWARGAEVEGWARYWNHVHAWLARRLRHDATLRAATLLVRHETLCRDPVRTLRALFEHCRLAAPPALTARAPRQIHLPDYHQLSFTPQESALIEHLTRDTARALGLDGECAPVPAWREASRKRAQRRFA